MTLHRRLAWIYFLGFMAVVIVTHFPGLTDDQGRNLGLFKIDPLDDVVHLLSALFGAFAAWYSTRLSIHYFRLFGGIYFADAVVGLLAGLATLPPLINLALNLPHLVISSAALVFGFLLHRKSLAAR